MYKYIMNSLDRLTHNINRLSGIYDTYSFTTKETDYGKSNRDLKNIARVCGSHPDCPGLDPHLLITV